MTFNSVVIQSPVNSGAPEGHEAAMIAKVDATNAATQAVAQPDPLTVPAQSEERPSWLAEKFKTPEEMAKAYAELEAKLSKGTAPTETPTESTQTPDENAVKQELESKSLNLKDFTEEFNTSGALSEESYAKLEKAGYDKSLVDAYIQGQQALATQFQTAVFSLAGGADSYTDMVTWAKTNMSPAQQDAYNAAVSSGNLEQAKLAVAGLKALYAEEVGSEPQLQGGRTSAASEDVFESIAQVTAAMKNPLYQSDPAYRAKVQAKLGRSNVF